MTDILVFGAHPDDIEFGCGGILCKMAAQNKSIVLADFTLGDKGTNGTPEIRREESLKAAEVLGAKRIFLDFEDCAVMDSYEARLKVVRVIREYKPKLVIAPYWKGEETHPDHTACGTIVRYACRFARFKNILPEFPAHRVDGVLHYVYPTNEGLDFIVDVTDHVSTWKKMMSFHKSQMQTMPYEKWVLKIAAKLGVMIGKEYAQGLAKGNPVVIEDIMSISVGTREI